MGLLSKLKALVGTDAGAASAKTSHPATAGSDRPARHGAQVMKAGNLTEGDTLYDVPADDAVMAEAIVRARRTLRFFEDALRDPGPGMSYFSVKVRFPVDGGGDPEDNGEHIWLSGAEFDGEGNLFGIVGNEPQRTSAIVLGQRVGVRHADITDWMIVDYGRLTGGYTIRAIRDGMSAAERASFDETMGGMVIDAGDDRFPHDDTSPEGALLLYEDALAARDFEAAADLKDFLGEARDMFADRAEPMPEDIIAQTAETLRLGFIAEMAEAGPFQVEGVRRAFPSVRFSEERRQALVHEVMTYADGEAHYEHIMSATPAGWRVYGLLEPDGGT